MMTAIIKEAQNRGHKILIFRPPVNWRKIQFYCHILSVIVAWTDFNVPKQYLTIKDQAILAKSVQDKKSSFGFHT